MMSIYEAKAAVFKSDMDKEAAVELCGMLDRLARYRRYFKQADDLMEKMKARVALRRAGNVHSV